MKAFAFLLFWSFLFITPLSYAQDDCGTLLFTKEQLDKLKYVKGVWGDLEGSIRFRSWIDDEFAYKRFINPADYDEYVTKMHATEIYKNGLKQYQSFKAANNYLRKIPKGKFKVSQEIIKDVHKVSMKGVYRIDEKILSWTQGILGVQAPGKYKLYKNFGFSPLTRETLTEAQFKAIQDNPLLGFIETPASKVGARKGLIVFPGGKKVKTEMANLEKWYQENKGKMHPIALAAIFQRKMVSIHPFYNGNGRTSRIVMERILAEFGFPPPILRNQQLDLYLSESDWVKEVYQGVIESLELAKKSTAKYKKRKLYEHMPAVGMKNLGNYIDEVEKYPFVVDKLFPGTASSEIKIGGESFIFYKDGFLYNNKGIPHIYNEADKSLYPISDQTYMLYGLNGKKLDAPFKGGPTKVDVRYRDRTVFSDEVFQKNYELVTKYHKKVSDDLAETIKVQPYSKIKQANLTNEIHLYPWQDELIKKAIRIEGNNAMAILSPNSGQFSAFERAFHKKGRTNVSQALAQYLRMDIVFGHYSKFAKKNFPELVADVEKSRQKMFKAMKVIQKDFIKTLDELEPEVKAIVLKHPKIKLIQEYLEYSPMKFATFKEAKLAFGESSYLLRSDMSFAKNIGFLTESHLKKGFTRIPFSKQIISFLKRKSAKNPNNMSLKRFINRVSENIYEYRGVDEEFGRKYVDMHLHALNEANKTAISFSTRADQYIGKYGTFSFKGLPDQKYNLFIVKVGNKNVYDNFASGWFNQYEVLVDKYVPPYKIVKKFDEEYFAKEWFELSDADKDVAEKFLKKDFLKDLHHLTID